MRQAANVILLLILGLGALLIRAHVAHSGDRDNLTPDARMHAVSLGCTELKTTFHLRQLIDENDDDALFAFWKPRKALGFCASIEAGDRIAIEQRWQPADEEYLKEHHGIFYCVRPYGDPNCYWMSGNTTIGKPG
jgi:hypothetical protein